MPLRPAGRGDFFPPIGWADRLGRAYSAFVSALSAAFGLAANTAVFVCTHVSGGGPVLYVAHDDEGNWQFLCDREHEPSEMLLVCLEHVLARDPSLSALADLCPLWSATRRAPAAQWERHDDYEEVIRRHVADVGWAVTMVASGDAGEPAFAYTTGLFRSAQHPELIVLGLPCETMGAVLNTCGELAKTLGGRLPLAERVDGVLDGFPVKLREVRTRDSYRAHVGYSLWFHDGYDFPLWQVLWPDRNGVFPDEAGVDTRVDALQPRLP